MFGKVLYFVIYFAMYIPVNFIDPFKTMRDESSEVFIWGNKRNLIADTDEKVR